MRINRLTWYKHQKASNRFIVRIVRSNKAEGVKDRGNQTPLQSCIKLNRRKSSCSQPK